jgi:WD40 repeat protein
MRYLWRAAPMQQAWLGILLGCLLFSLPLSAQQPEPRWTFLGHSKDVRCVAISPDGKTIASGSHDNTVRFWDVASGKEQATLNVADYGVDSVAFSPDGKTLAVGCGGNTIKLSDVNSHKMTIVLNIISQYARPMVVFSPDGRTLASGGRCIGDVKLWDVPTGKSLTTLKGYDAYGISAMAFTPDGGTLTTMGVHGGIKTWEAATGKKLPRPPPPEAAARLIARLGDDDFRSRQQASDELLTFGLPVLPALRKAAQAKNDVEVQRRLETLISQIEKTTLLSVRSSRCTAFSPDGKILTAEDEDGHLKLWELATGKEWASLKGDTVDVWSVVFSPDGRILASGTEDGTIQLWEVATARELATLKGHSERVTSLAFRADSRMLVSGSEDKTIKLWEVVNSK